MVRVLTFDDLKIWLFVQQLSSYNQNYTNNLYPIQQYICYFKFSEPTIVVYGELIFRPENKQPMVFTTVEEAEQYAFEYLRKRFFEK